MNPISIDLAQVTCSPFLARTSVPQRGSVTPGWRRGGVLLAAQVSRHCKSSSEEISIRLIGEAERPCKCIQMRLPRARCESFTLRGRVEVIMELLKNSGETVSGLRSLGGRFMSLSTHTHTHTFAHTQTVTHNHVRPT